MPHPHSNLVEQYDNIEIDISSLAAVTGVLGVGKVDASRTQGFRTLFQEGIVKINGGVVTSPTGGPVYTGFIPFGMSLAEMEEKLEADPQSSDDSPATEQQLRRVFPFGYLDGSVGSGAAKAQLDFRTKHKWSYQEEGSLNYFAYNTDLNTALPASSQCQIHVKHTGVWLND